MAEPGPTLPLAYWILLGLSGLTALAAAAAFFRDQRGYGEPLAATALGLVVVALIVQNRASRIVRERHH